VADERDCVRLRTNYRGEDVYLTGDLVSPSEPIYFNARSSIWPALLKPVDRICGSADFAGWPFRIGMAHGLGVRPEEIGSRQGHWHREICSAGSVGIVARIQFRSRGSTARDSTRTFG